MSDCTCLFTAPVTVTESLSAEVLDGNVLAVASVDTGIVRRSVARFCEAPAIIDIYILLESGGILLLETGQGLAPEYA